MSYVIFCLSLVGLSSAADLEKRDESSAATFYATVNDDLARLTLLVLGCMAAFIYVWKLWFHMSSYLRLLASFNNEKQRYFISANKIFAKVKNHIIYAPLFRTRHNREFQLSQAVNFGTLPSRFHAFILVGIIAMNVVVCVVTTPYGQSEDTVAGVVRNRTGVMATVNLIPLVLLAGRNNPLITLLQVPFDTFNLIHRWLARIVVLETLAHIFAYCVDKADKSGWDVVWKSFGKSNFLLYGLIGGCAFVGLMLHSPSPIRHAFYETFLHLHIAMTIVAIIGLWVHLDGFPQQIYVLIAIIIWGLERALRVATVLYRNCGRKLTTAHVEVMAGDAMRITLKTTRPWTFKPGQHIYLYIPTVGLWMSHPFSVAWSDTESALTDEKGIPMTRQDFLGLQKTTVSLVVRRRTGFTDTLFKRAQNSPDSRISLKAFAEGPYGGMHSMDSYGTVALFAGGVGITHMMPFVRHLVQGYAQGTLAVRRVTLVWIIQSPEHLEWIRPWMTSILAMERRREVLRVKLFITRPRNTKEIQSPSSTVQMFPGRPNIDTLVGMEVDNQIGAMGVLVCGNGSLSDDVRRVCRQRQNQTYIDFVEESFTW